MRFTTPHYDRVKYFMQLANQATPEGAQYPDAKTRKLRAALILEEAFETIAALAVEVHISNGESTMVLEPGHEPDVEVKHAVKGFSRTAERELLTDLVDGCIDTDVVVTGTLISAGIPDEPFLELIDDNNLEKFGDGFAVRGDGKLIKSPLWTPPNVKGLIDSFR